MIRQEIVQFRHNAMKAAKDLGYSDDVVKKIKAAKSDSEVDKIMRNARKEKFG